MKIIILNELPIIFTKDANWVKGFYDKNNRIRPGYVIALPEDAILAIPPQIIRQEVKNVSRKRNM